jgi:2-keto-3-deoxy-L-rhamnonate aldolase RhmA
MIDLLQITNDPVFARRCAAMPGMRLFVDLERMGKVERQAGKNTFISSHDIDDVARIKAVAGATPVMVRVNPVHPDSAAEIDAVLGRGADMVMLPMFRSAAELSAFAALVDGRVPVVPLLETAEALASLEDWVSTPGLAEIFVGLNDLHLSLGCDFMFEPLAQGHVDRVATAARQQGLRFGFGGIARMDEGLLPGRDVLAEHVRLGSQAVILSRTFHRSNVAESFEAEVARLRDCERELTGRSVAEQQSDQVRIEQSIRKLAAQSVVCE